MEENLGKDGDGSNGIQITNTIYASIQVMWIGCEVE